MLKIANFYNNCNKSLFGYSTSVEKKKKNYVFLQPEWYLNKDD